MFQNWFTVPFCSSPHVDNFVYKLCYRWTVLFLLLFSFVITSKLAIGDSFECESNGYFDRKYLNVKCYADGIYTILSQLIIQTDKHSSQNYRRYHLYYQWVNLLFLVQAFNFYLPHLLWKCYDGGHTAKLTEGMQNSFTTEERRGLELSCLAKYLIVTRGKHRFYTLAYIFFEMCNYAVSLAQALWLIKFFDVTGVPGFLPFALETWSEFRQLYFPPSGLCELARLGPSGNAQRVTAMCGMPLNHLYMYMFLFLHAWYIFMTVLTGLILVYRVALLLPHFRYFSAKMSASMAERSVLRSVCHSMSYCDWFFITRVQKTITDADFAQLLQKLAVKVLDEGPLNEDRKSSLLEQMVELENSSATSPS